MLIAAVLALAAERGAIGVWERWAALREGTPPRCFAIAQPVRDDGTTDRRGGYVSVVARSGPKRSPSVFFRLSRPRGSGALVTLAVGERRFALAGDSTTAQAGDAATDRAIVAAMRAARLMTLATTDSAGRAIADSYTLAGAPTAIDAAQLGCSGG